MLISYSLINKLYKKRIIDKLPNFLIRKIRKKFNIYFIPSEENILPEKNYPIIHSYEAQKILLNNFKLSKKQESFSTCQYLITLLSSIFNKDSNFKFLDIGGENIDFYLELKEKFPNINYYIFNQKIILDNLKKIKEENNLKDFNIIYKVEDLLNNNYDFINCGSVIQYVKDYKSLLLNLINVSNKYIFFSATHFFDSSKKNEDNLIVKQVNLLPKVFFLYFFNKKFFYKLLFDNKYKIVFEKKNLTDNLNYKNFDEFVENTQYTDVLFKK